jgi:cysteine desulfurase/selenocysteine lyase
MTALRHDGAEIAVLESTPEVPSTDNAEPQLPSDIDVAYVSNCFPGLDGVTFLDHAAASPLPRPSIDALVAMAERLGSSNPPSALDYADQLRVEVAQLINGEPSGVALTRSTAHGIALLAGGLDFAPGDNVVVVEGDYPTAIYPWLARQQRDSLEVRFVRPGDGPVTPQLVLAETDERTRVVCLAEVMFVTGYRIDVATIGADCRERGILFCVDGMQSVGAFEMDVVASNIDVLSSGAVKWLLGPNGVSFCWMRNDLIPQLPPLIPGALTVANPMDFTNIDPVWAHDAHRFEETWLPLPEMAALETSIQMAKRIGLETIARQVRENVTTLAASLVEMGANLRGPWPRVDQELSGIVSFSHKGASGDHIGSELNRARVRFSRRGENIRLSPHYYNTPDDLDRALQAIATAVR